MQQFNKIAGYYRLIDFAHLQNYFLAKPAELQFKAEKAKPPFRPDRRVKFPGPG